MSRIIQNNQTLELIYNRKTIRAYNPKSLTQEEINTIIHGAMRAPTAGNLMLYSIIQVSDQKMKDKLAITCDNQPHISKAPLVLIFLADMQRWWDYFSVCKVPELCEEMGEPFQTPQESDLLLASCDALIAAKNTVITAESLGIGSCYIGDITEFYEVHREMFNLSKWTFPIAMVCFGYPKGDREKIPLTSRFPQKFIHFKNKYKRLNKQELIEMFQNIDRKIVDKKVKNLGQDLYLRKMGANFSKEMRRSVKEAIKEWLSENGSENSIQGVKNE